MSQTSTLPHKVINSFWFTTDSKDIKNGLKKVLKGLKLKDYKNIE